MSSLTELNFKLELNFNFKMLIKFRNQLQVPLHIFEKDTKRGEEDA